MAFLNLGLFQKFFSWVFVVSGGPLPTDSMSKQKLTDATKNHPFRNATRTNCLSTIEKSQTIILQRQKKQTNAFTQGSQKNPAKRFFWKPKANDERLPLRLPKLKHTGTGLGGLLAFSLRQLSVFLFLKLDFWFKVI